MENFELPSEAITKAIKNFENDKKEHNLTQDKYPSEEAFFDAMIVRTEELIRPLDYKDDVSTGLVYSYMSFLIGEISAKSENSSYYLKLYSEFDLSHYIEQITENNIDEAMREACSYMHQYLEDARKAYSEKNYRWLKPIGDVLACCLLYLDEFISEYNG